MEIEKIKSIFEKYKIYKLRIENFKNFDCFVNSNNSRELKTKYFNWDKYVKLVNKILDNLDKEHSHLLKSIYIENKKKEELHYSDSTYYWKHKKATNNFLKYIDFNHDISTNSSNK